MMLRAGQGARGIARSTAQLLTRLLASSALVPANEKRMSTKLMYGGHANDFADLDEVCRKSLDCLRNKAEVALVTRNLYGLEEAAAEAICWMKELPPKHPVHVDRRLTFVTKPSPLSHWFLSGLRNVFLRVADLRSNGYGCPTDTKYQAAQPNNAAGMALEGAEGVGKTNLLRLFALVPAVVFPKSVVSVYVDYFALGKENQGMPSRLLADALQAATGEAIESPASLDHALDAITANGRVAVFAADGVESVYLNSAIWGNFHSLADDYSHTLFVTDTSGSKVRAMVELRGHENQLRRWFPSCTELPHSLNQDKMQVVNVAPLSTNSHYRAFLSWKTATTSTTSSTSGLSSSYDCKAVAATENDQELDQYIRDLHARTGGRLRALMLPACETRICLLGTGNPARVVLEKLCTLQARLGACDPFNPVAVSGNQVRAWLDECTSLQPSSSSSSDAPDINDLLDANYLTKTANGKYTFAYFEYYRLLRDEKLIVTELH